MPTSQATRRQQQEQALAFEKQTLQAFGRSMAPAIEEQRRLLSPEHRAEVLTRLQSQYGPRGTEVLHELMRITVNTLKDTWNAFGVDNKYSLIIRVTKDGKKPHVAFHIIYNTGIDARGGQPMSLSIEPNEDFKNIYNKKQWLGLSDPYKSLMDKLNKRFNELANPDSADYNMPLTKLALTHDTPIKIMPSTAQTPPVAVSPTTQVTTGAQIASIGGRRTRRPRHKLRRTRRSKRS